MPHLRLALIATLFWLAACGLAIGLAMLMGLGTLWLVLSLLGCAAAILGTCSLAIVWDARDRRTLSAVALAAGLADKPDEPLTMAAIVARLGRRLERAHHFKSALTTLHQPALLVDGQGRILAASIGISTLRSDAIEGATLDAVFGAGYLDAGGGAPEEGMVVLAGQRFSVRRSSVATDRYCLELIPAGVYLEDDDLDAFAGALTGGQTSFRFGSDAAHANRALAALNTAMSAMDAGLLQLDRVASGQVDMHDVMHGPLGGVARRLNDFAGAVLEQVSEEQASRQRLESRLAAVGNLVAGFERKLAELSQHAAENAYDAGSTGRALSDSNLRLRQTALMGRDAQSLASAADLAIRRTQAVVGEVDQMTRDVDKMVQAIEDVSFRTNLLALNAAVEAARAGEKGAGFAVVADEVRQLAQITNRSAKDIREVVSRGRAQAETGVAEAKSLQKMIVDLDSYLRNLSNETDTIAVTLDQGELALKRLTLRLASFGAPAETVLQPARRAIA